MCLFVFVFGGLCIVGDLKQYGCCFGQIQIGMLLDIEVVGFVVFVVVDVVIVCVIVVDLQYVQWFGGFGGIIVGWVVLQIG